MKTGIPRGGTQNKIRANKASCPWKKEKVPSYFLRVSLHIQFSTQTHIQEIYLLASSLTLYTIIRAIKDFRISKKNDFK